jgi:hypothetical protein
MKKYNIYIDESCHLEHDNSNVMCIGYTHVPEDRYIELRAAIKKLKLKHKSPTEIKWNSLSKSRWELYKELIDLFFCNDIEFRAILIKDKNNLGPKSFSIKDQHSYYYKSLSVLLQNKVFSAQNNYYVFLDVKDTRGKQRIRFLENELKITLPEKSPFVCFQHLHSDDNEFLQLTDLFIGAICYKARNLHKDENASEVRVKIINYLEKVYGYTLDDGTAPWDTKFYIDDFRIKTPKHD